MIPRLALALIALLLAAPALAAPTMDSTVILRFTLPAYEPAQNSCGSALSAKPERLGEVRLYGWGAPPWTQERQDDTTIRQRHTVSGKEGMPDSFVVVSDGRPWTWCVSVTDSAGNESLCRPCIAVGKWPGKP